MVQKYIQEFFLWTQSSKRITNGGFLSRNTEWARNAKGDSPAEGFSKEKGFALIAAIMTICVLLAVGLLVFGVSTKDIRISSRLVGEKKAFSAAQGGIHQLTKNFNPAALGSSATDHPRPIDSNCPDSQYSIAAPTIPALPPASIPEPGFDMSWGRTRYVASVTGTDTAYNSSVQISAGVGYGPVKMGTEYN